MRLIAVLVLLAVLPTAELAEQIVHVVEHAITDDELADHGAHHSSMEDEHGCTALVHLCSCHHAQVTIGIRVVVARAIETWDAVNLQPPRSMADLTTPEPVQRPPIARASIT
jgi:hypothetical protein